MTAATIAKNIERGIYSIDELHDIARVAIEALLDANARNADVAHEAEFDALMLARRDLRHARMDRAAAVDKH